MVFFPHRHLIGIKGLTEQDWSGLAGKGRTLVIYMGLATAEAIADKLIAQGIQVARRTVAKYREAMQIPPVSQRKTF